MDKSNAKPRARHPQLEPVGDLRIVRAKLILAGWRSMKAWADAHGYKRVTLSYAVRSWGMRTDKEPHGGLSRAVMRDLRATIDQEQRP